MIDQILDVASRLGHWAYALVFVVAALEAAAFLGLVVPGETLTMGAGFLISAGVLDLVPTILAAALGATVGDSIGYELVALEPRRARREVWRRRALSPDHAAEYFRRNCGVSVDPDEDVVRHAIPAMGDDNIVISTDWPHDETSKRKILWDHCARLYGLS